MIVDTVAFYIFRLYYNYSHNVLWQLATFFTELYMVPHSPHTAAFITAQ